MQPSTRVFHGSSRMCYLGWACGPGRFLWSVPLNALSASTTAALGLHVQGHIPAYSLYYLFMGLLSASLSNGFLNLLMLSASNLTWRQASEVYYLLCQEQLTPTIFRDSPLVPVLQDLVNCHSVCVPSQMPSWFVNLNHNTLFFLQKRSLNLSGVFSQGSCPITWVGFAVCLLLSRSCGVKTRSVHTTWNRGTPGL